MNQFCTYCNQEKSVEEFYSWYKSRCKSCHAKVRTPRTKYNGSSIIPHLGLKLTQRDVARFWIKVDKKTFNECWIWQSHTSSPPDRPESKYGRFKFHGKDWYAHRLLAEILWGEVPVGYNIDHTCKNKLCVNPNHLEIVTVAENNRRARHKPRITPLELTCVKNCL